MNRKDFAFKLTLLGACPLIVQKFSGSEILPAMQDQDEKYRALLNQKEFVENWLSDLLSSMEKHIDRKTQEKIVGGCGKACFERHQFKKDIAVAGSGDLNKLIEAYKKNFEVWKEDNKVHIRYGEVSEKCYCPAANYRTSKPDDIHCECTRNTHKAVFEAALGKPFRVEISESLRRGGKTCHFIVYMT